MQKKNTQNKKIIKTSATTVAILTALSAVAIVTVTAMNKPKNPNRDTDITEASAELNTEPNEDANDTQSITPSAGDKTGLDTVPVTSPAADNSNNTEGNAATATDAAENTSGRDDSPTPGDEFSEGKVIPAFESVVLGGRIDKTKEADPDDDTTISDSDGSVAHTKVGLSALTTDADYTEVDGSYFDDALFIGNSRTVGLLLWSGVSGIDLAYTGLNVCTAYTAPAKNYKGKKVSVMEAMTHKKFTKAYIMFGVNEVGWMSSEVFTENYRKIIQDIHKKNPDSVIYVQSILPVTEKFEKERGDITNKKIAKFNKALKKLADEEGVIYLNVAECIIDDRGYLPQDESPDGYHMNQPNCVKWLNYLSTHAIVN